MNRIAEESKRRLLARRNALSRENPPELRHGAGNAALVAQGKDLSKAEREELAEIDAALARIELGTYGHCEVCSGAIGRQRLLAVPLARRCLACLNPDDSVPRTG